MTADPIEAGYIAVYLWAAAVEKAGSFDVEKVKAAAEGIDVRRAGGQGHRSTATNQHIYKTARIGKISADGLIEEVWNSGKPIKPDPYLKSYPWATGLS